AVTAFFAGAFFAAGFVAAAFFAATFLAEAFLPATFTLLASAEPALATKNFVRSFAAASHAGAGPRPLQLAPVLGSRYFPCVAATQGAQFFANRFISGAASKPVVPTGGAC
ncbi:MAG: hypothetical protein QOJ04_3454, partial [Caballeronia sp.]|nr:hypothetical protein [Caballeronia sp.]